MRNHHHRLLLLGAIGMALVLSSGCYARIIYGPPLLVPVPVPVPYGGWEYQRGYYGHPYYGPGYYR
jgi:hypothetical protein